MALHKLQIGDAELTYPCYYCLRETVHSHPSQLFSYFFGQDEGEDLRNSLKQVCSVAQERIFAERDVFILPHSC